MRASSSLPGGVKVDRVQDWLCVRALDLKAGRGTGVVLHLDEEARPTTLRELSGSRAPLHLDPHLRIDVDHHQAVRVENPLYLLRRLGTRGLTLERPDPGRMLQTQRAAQILQGVGQA